MSIRLYVGNLPKESIERESLETMFADAGNGVSTKVIKDRKTGKCRGFAFVTVPNDEVADAFIEKYNGQPFMDSTLKIEKALPRAKGKTDEQGETNTNNEVETPDTASNNANRRKGGNKRPRRQTANNNTQQSGGFQPDPRWADELAKLKEMLAAQASN
jgi:RNA recognition motif-containing protein